MAKVGIGIIGCGGIFPAYVNRLKTFDHVETLLCSDLDEERARSAAAEFGLPGTCPVDELVDDPNIDIVVNLTNPLAHSEVSLKAIRAGKNVFSEKPLAVDLDEGKAVLREASARGVRVGCAPDTFLGGGQQTSRQVIERGDVGSPIAACGFMVSRGPANWHPNPGPFYQKGAGPMFDVGVYYITALIHLLGPVRSVSGSVSASGNERVITAGPNEGESIRIDTPTHYSGTLEFHSGAIATLIASFDVYASALPRIEVYGSTASLAVPDPNGFGGQVKLYGPGSDAWDEVAPTHPESAGRGLGVAEMAWAILSDRRHRASGEMALHVLETMLAFEESSATGKRIDVTSTCGQPEPLPAGTEIVF